MRILHDEMSDQLATKTDLIQMGDRLIKLMIGLVLASTAINVTVTVFLVTL